MSTSERPAEQATVDRQGVDQDARSTHATISERRQHRIDHGLCPACGEEAAPYYLCERHRQIGSIGRMMNKMAARGIVTKAKINGKSWYSISPEQKSRVDDFYWHATMWDFNAEDNRLKPRLGRRPVDLDDTLSEIFREAGKPLTMEEIYAAWGGLRSRRKTISLAGDMTMIIKAQRRRGERNLKRLKREGTHV